MLLCPLSYDGQNPNTIPKNCYDFIVTLRHSKRLALASVYLVASVVFGPPPPTRSADHNLSPTPSPRNSAITDEEIIQTLEELPKAVQKDVLVQMIEIKKEVWTPRELARDPTTNNAPPLKLRKQVYPDSLFAPKKKNPVADESPAPSGNRLTEVDKRWILKLLKRIRTQSSKNDSVAKTQQLEKLMEIIKRSRTTASEIGPPR